MKLVDSVLQVGQQLWLHNMGSSEVEHVKRKGVKGLRSVDLRARIDVVPPGSTNAIRLFINGESFDAGLSQTDSHANAACSRSDHCDRYLFHSAAAGNTHILLLATSLL